MSRLPPKRIVTSSIPQLDAWTRQLDQVLGTRVPFNVVPADQLAHVPRLVLAAWCQLRGLYVLSTDELVADIKNVIAGRPALEICAGSSPLGAALGIQQVDANPPANSAVLRQEAVAAVQALKPKVVVAAWSEQKGTAELPSSSVSGVDEDVLITLVDCYILVGNQHAHSFKKVLKQPHTERHAPYIISRSTHPDEDVIWTWGR